MSWQQPKTRKKKWIGPKQKMIKLLFRSYRLPKYSKARTKNHQKQIEWDLNKND